MGLIGAWRIFRFLPTAILRTCARGTADFPALPITAAGRFAIRIRGHSPPLQLRREPIGRVKSAPEKSAPSKRVGRRGFARSAPMAEAWRAAIAALRYPARARAETAQIFILPTLARGIFRRFGRIVLPACGVLE